MTNSFLRESRSAASAHVTSAIRNRTNWLGVSLAQPNDSTTPAKDGHDQADGGHRCGAPRVGGGGGRLQQPVTRRRRPTTAACASTTTRADVTTTSTAANDLDHGRAGHAHHCDAGAHDRSASAERRGDRRHAVLHGVAGAQRSRSLGERHQHGGRPGERGIRQDVGRDVGVVELPGRRGLAVLHAGGARPRMSSCASSDVSPVNRGPWSSSGTRRRRPTSPSSSSRRGSSGAQARCRHSPPAARRRRRRPWMRTAPTDGRRRAG